MAVPSAEIGLADLSRQKPVAFVQKKNNNFSPEDSVSGNNLIEIPDKK
jgi:hypothetical protein